MSTRKSQICANQLCGNIHVASSWLVGSTDNKQSPSLYTLKTDVYIHVYKYEFIWICTHVSTLFSSWASP